MCRYATRNQVPALPCGAPCVGVITELNGWPACSPVNACNASLRTRRHDSGPWRGATAFHVRLFHSLLHAGLSRRSWCPRISRGRHTYPDTQHRLATLIDCGQSPGKGRCGLILHSLQGSGGHGRGNRLRRGVFPMNPQCHILHNTAFIGGDTPAQPFSHRTIGRHTMVGD